MRPARPTPTLVFDAELPLRDALLAGYARAVTLAHRAAHAPGLPPRAAAERVAVAAAACEAVVAWLAEALPKKERRHIQRRFEDVIAASEPWLDDARLDHGRSLADLPPRAGTAPPIGGDATLAAASADIDAAISALRETPLALAGALGDGLEPDLLAAGLGELYKDARKRFRKAVVSDATPDVVAWARSHRRVALLAAPLSRAGGAVDLADWLAVDRRLHDVVALACAADDVGLDAPRERRGVELDRTYRAARPLYALGSKKWRRRHVDPAALDR